MAKSQDLIYQNFSANQATAMRWLTYPRQLQQEYGVNPILAGGALRDLILGGGALEPTDLDIFVSRSAWLSERAIFNFVGDMAERESWDCTHDLGYDTPQRNVHSIYTFKDEMVDIPYNIIVLEDDTTASGLIDGFNFGINMIAINTYGILTISPHFIHDMEKQQITIRNEYSREITLERYERLLKKYHMPLVTAEGLEVEKPFSGLILPPV